MINGIFNVVSHKSLIKTGRYMDLVNLLMIVILSCFIFVLIKNIKKSKNILILFLIFFGYVSYLFYNVNWLGYNRSLSLLGIQGRYVFPVISCFVVIWAYSFINLFNKKWISVLLICGIFVFMFLGEGYYLFKNYKKWCFDNPWFSYELGNVGEINKGEFAEKQMFDLSDESEDTLGIGIYFSTYSKEIRDGFYLNLYKGNNCQDLLESIPIKGIKDNNFAAVRFSDDLDKNFNYCFDIENRNSDNPVTIWYSGLNVDEKEYIYDLLERRLMDKYSLGN